MYINKTHRVVSSGPHLFLLHPICFTVKGKIRCQRSPYGLLQTDAACGGVRPVSLLCSTSSLPAEAPGQLTDKSHSALEITAQCFTLPASYSNMAVVSSPSSSISCGFRGCRSEYCVCVCVCVCVRVRVCV